MQMKAIRVLLVNPDQESADNLRELLAQVEDIDIIGNAESAEKLFFHIRELSPDIVMLDDQLLSAYRLAEQITQEFLELAVVILASPPAEEAYRKGIQAGARDVLLKPFSPLALADTIYKAHDYIKKRRAALPVPAGETPSTSTGARVITVFSTKGGAGKSTVAVNLAVCLAQKLGRKRVVLWDLDLHCGVVGVAANLVPRRQITDLVNEIQYLDQELMENYLETHNSGMQVLTAPFTPEFADYISGEHVNRILNTLRGYKDFVVIDTSSYFHDPVMAALENADTILLVGALDLATVKNLKACLLVMERLNYPRSKLRLLINRGNLEFGVLPRDVEATLKMPVFATLPSDGKVAITALNQGTPVAYAYYRTDLGRAFESLAERFVNKDVGETAVVPAPDKSITGLFGKRQAERKEERHHVIKQAT